MYYKARFYDNALGRFVSPDTIIPESSQGVQAWDRYAGMNNNPVRWNDPSGHCIDPDSYPCTQPTYPNDPLQDPDYSEWRKLQQSAKCTACHVTHDGYGNDWGIPDNSELDSELIEYYRSKDPIVKMVHAVGMQTVGNMYALADEYYFASRSPEVKGKFPTTSDGEYLQRADPHAFARYDNSTGDVMYRVDIVGPADASVPTPHLQSAEYNVNPSTGMQFMNDWSDAVPYINLNYELAPLAQAVLFLVGILPP